MASSSSHLIIMSLLISFLSVNLLLLPSTFVSAEMPEGKKFNYSNPKEWGELHPDFALCSSGKQQSPIDIVDTETVLNKTLSRLSRVYRIDNATLVNTGHTIEVEVKGYSKLKIDGKKYKLTQFHWHTPSEHRLNGALYPAELHLVHASSDGSLAVIAVLYQYGKPEPLVSQTESHLDNLVEKECGEDEGKGIFFEKFNAKPLKHEPRKYYRYQGSLTTPPCSEKVTWTVLSKVRTMSKHQGAALRSPLCEVNKDNSRPEQSLHGRVVQRFVKGRN